MDWPNSFDQFLNWVSEAQRQTLKSWTSAMPGGQHFDTPSTRESFNNALNFQEQIITNSLEAQAVIARLIIDSQKQLWQNYFNMLRSK
jgi:hypothetical protein